MTPQETIRAAVAAAPVFIGSPLSASAARESALNDDFDSFFPDCRLPGEDLSDDMEPDTGPPSPSRAPDDVDLEIVKKCAELDHNDVDNGARILAHFGDDLVVHERIGAPDGDWLAWEGRYWDFGGGEARAKMIAQKLGERIALECALLEPDKAEQEAIAAAARFTADNSSAGAKEAREGAVAARAALAKRQHARWAFGQTSKNGARMREALSAAAPHLRKPSSAFNRDPLLVVTQTHTLRFIREPDPECPDPEVVRFVARVEASQNFERDDLATAIVPVDYDPRATAPKWEAFLDRCMPDKNIRRTVQQYCGTGLLGVLLQRLMFHHGFGANGKSVFISVLEGVIGDSYSVGLPKESLIGASERGAGSASPDLVRLFGKRFLSVAELKEGKSLREDLVKRLTGGDKIVVRDLFRGYRQFANVATPVMSGNGFPKVEGTDLGIWRRMLVVHWSVTIPPEERREFDEFVADLLSEKSGIFNWLVEGAIDFLANSLVVAEPIFQATAAYREDMDPIGRFCLDCVREAPGQRVGARAMYEAYVSWAKANAIHVRFETKFGLEMKKRFTRDDKRTRSYVGVELHDVPARPGDGHAPPPETEDFA